MRWLLRVQYEKTLYTKLSSLLSLIADNTISQSFQLSVNNEVTIDTQQPH